MKRAFTLIELVVVVSIIATLASVVIVQTGHAQKQARDNKRAADIVNIQAALELYYAKYRSYPTYFFNVAGCTSSYFGFFDARIQLDSNYIVSHATGSTCTTFNPRIAPEFINAIPRAPKAPAQPQQYPNPFDGYYYLPSAVSGSVSRYLLCTALENSSSVSAENANTGAYEIFASANNGPGNRCNYQVHSPGW